LSDRQVLVAPVPLRRGATLYERFGDLPTLVLSALALAAGLAAGILGRRRAGQGPPVVEHRRAVDGRLRRRDPTGE
jgi:hypothetical protein